MMSVTKFAINELDGNETVCIKIQLHKVYVYIYECVYVCVCERGRKYGEENYFTPSRTGGKCERNGRTKASLSCNFKKKVNWSEFFVPLCL